MVIRERHHIDLLRPTLNKQIPTRTQKEYNKDYYENNIEKMRKKNRDYWAQNKEQDKEKRMEYHKIYRENNKEQLTEKKK